MKNMTPSMELITEGQIGKICELINARLRKSKIMSKPLQDVIEHQGSSLVDKVISVITEMVDMVSNFILRLVKVDRKRSPKEALNATGRKQYTNDSVVAEMPKGNGDEVEVFFFNLGRFISDDDLEKEYELRGLKSADPYSLSAVNEADPALADTHPNATHWKDKNGKWCFAAFSRWDVDERYVNVNRDGNDWDDSWWFAGVRK